MPEEAVSGCIGDGDVFTACSQHAKLEADNTEVSEVAGLYSNVLGRRIYSWVTNRLSLPFVWYVITEGVFDLIYITEKKITMIHLMVCD